MRFSSSARFRESQGYDNPKRAIPVWHSVLEKARTDAAHIAIAAVHGMDFLVTWNCRHIANAEKEPHIREVCARHGWRCPEICTPEQLLPKEEGETP